MLRLEHERIGIMTLEASHFNARVTVQDIQCAIVRSVIEEDISLDQRIIVTEEEAR